MQSVDAAAKVARRLHKQHMGRRYIEIFEVCSGIELQVHDCRFLILRMHTHTHMHKGRYALTHTHAHTHIQLIHQDVHWKTKMKLYNWLHTHDILIPTPLHSARVMKWRWPWRKVAVEGEDTAGKEEGEGHIEGVEEGGEGILKGEGVVGGDRGITVVVVPS